MRKEEEAGNIRFYDFCLPEQSPHILKPYFLGSGWTWPADEK